MQFSESLKLLKQNKKIRQRCWKDPNAFIQAKDDVLTNQYDNPFFDCMPILNGVDNDDWEEYTPPIKYYLFADIADRITLGEKLARRNFLQGSYIQGNVYEKIIFYNFFATNGCNFKEYAFRTDDFRHADWYILEN